MDRDKRIEVIRKIVEHTKRWNEMHPELSGDPTLLMSDVEMMVEEIDRLQQRLTDYEGCKGIEEYYAVLSEKRRLHTILDEHRGRLQELTFEVSRLREERDALAKELEFKRWYAEKLHGERTVAEAERDKLLELAKDFGVAPDVLRALGIGEDNP